LPMLDNWRERGMSTVFDVPCPDCGRTMAVEAEGNLQCPSCRGVYHLRMGHLFPAGDPTPGPRPTEILPPATAASS